MSILGPISITRAALAVAAAWLLFPHQPDVGLGRPQTIQLIARQTQSEPCAHDREGTCDGAVFGAMLGAVGDMETFRAGLIHTIDRVRADLAANGVRRR